MEQQARELIEGYTDRQSVLDRIEASWARQSRATTAEEIEEWIQVGRE